MKKIFLISLILSITSLQINATDNKFTCNSNSYLFTSDQEASETGVFNINMKDANVSFTKTFANSHINATGYNIKDDYIYGWEYGEGANYQNNYDPHLVKIDADFNVERVQLSGSLSNTRFYLGDIDKNGIFYLANRHEPYNTNVLQEIQRVDLNTKTVLSKLTLDYPVGTKNIIASDFAINPIDNQLYTISAYYVDNNGTWHYHNQLVQINVNTGKVKELGYVGDIGDTYSVINFFDKYGNFYFYAKGSNKIYKIDISNPNTIDATATPFTNQLNGMIDSGDGVRCANATMDTEPQVKPFNCADAQMYFSNETELGTVGDDSVSDGMYLHVINKDKSPFSFNKIGDKYTYTYNALAYNPEDNFLYALYGAMLLQIDKNGVVKELGDINEFSEHQKYSATFDKDGYYYVGDWQDRTKIYKIDIKTKTIVETMILETSLNYIDMTISQHGSEKYLYLLNRSEINNSDKTNQLVKVNISQMKENGKYGYETIGDKVSDEEEADSIFYDAADKLYVLFHKGGFYQIDTTSGKRIPISSAPELANLNDGAICPNATINLKPTISIGDATVVEGDSGERELIFPVTLINNDNPKSLTYTYQVYEGNSTNVLKNANSPEDFVKNNYSTNFVQELAEDSEIKVTVNSDTKIEKDEILNVVLSDINGALFVDTKAKGTIINDDNSNNFTAYDIGDTNKKIHTKIVKNNFKLTLAKLDSHGNLTSSEDENSTQVRIIDSSLCGVLFDGDMSGFVPFDMGGSSTQTSPIFNSSKALKQAKVQFYWKDALGEHTSCSNDAFSIRPDHYKLNIPSNISAGKDFEITVSAMGADDVVVSNYEELSSSYTLDINDTKANIGCALGIFSKKVKTDFVNGISTVTLNYDDVGKLKFKAIEVQTANSEYANIDKDDGSGITRFITTDESEKFINPSKIQALFNFKTKNTLPYTYFSDNPYEMGAIIEANITMLSENDTKVTNFSDSCWASDVDISIDYSQLNGSVAVASFSDDDTINLGNIILSNKISYKITKDKFTDAHAQKNLYLNYGRSIKTPKAPIQIKLSSPKVSLSSGLNKDVVKEKVYTFAYVRAHSAPEQSVVGDTIQAKVGYEVYIPKGIDKTLYGLDGLSLSENGGTWYNLPIDDAFGYKNSPTLRYGAGAHISTFDKESVTVRVSKTPHTNRVVYYPKGYLLFNKFNDTVASHSFKINLYSDAKQWSGKGKQGIIMDNDISNNVVKKMNW